MFKPLPEHIVQKAKEIGVDEIHLEFSGGYDEGYLNVCVYSNKVQRDKLKFKALESEIEEWAWSTDGFDYSGSGDGRDFGDSLVYNLETGECTHREWWLTEAEQVTNHKF